MSSQSMSQSQLFDYASIPQGVHVFDEPHVMTVTPAQISGGSDDSEDDRQYLAGAYGGSGYE